MFSIEKPNWARAATIFLCLAVGTAALWVAWKIGRLADASEAQVGQVGTQARLAVMSWRGVSHDLRRNWTANTELQEDLQKRMAQALDRAGAALDRSAAAIEKVSREAALTMDRSVTLAESLRDDLSPMVSTVLAETRQSLESARADLHAVSSSLEHSVAQAGDGVDRVSHSTSALLAQSECLLADARPIIQDGVRISHAAANVAAHYEQKLTRPSKWDRAKWILNTFLFGMGEIITPYIVAARGKVVR